MLRSIQLPPTVKLLLGAVRSDGESVGAYPPSHRAWKHLLTLATYHLVHPLVAIRLQAMPEGLVPESVRQSCDELVRRVQRRNYFLMSQAEQIGLILARERVASVLLKGPALAESVYGRYEMRYFRDLDLLVAREDLNRALEILQEVGLQSMMGAEIDHHYVEKHFHIPMTNGKGMVVELHWGLGRPDTPFGLGAPGVLQRSVARTEDGLCRTEAVEDQLLHAASQSLSDGFSQLVRVCDVDAILRLSGDNLDWDGILRRARAAHLDAAFELLVTLGSRLLGTPRPARWPANGFSGRAFTCLETLQPARMLLTRYTTHHKGYRELFRFWLLPGKRTIVFRHTLFGHPFNRQRIREQGQSTVLSRMILFGKRFLVVLDLVVSQVLALLRRSPDDPH